MKTWQSFIIQRFLSNGSYQRSSRVPNKNRKLHCLHCACAASAQGMKETLLAGEATTKDFWLFWKENTRHNGTEDPGHHQIIPYEDRFGCASDTALITWRADGLEFMGTQEGLDKRTQASKREATVDVEAVRKGDKDE